MTTPREPRPEIPEDIKRAVRQRCGFGCVLCGHPIIDYDHIHGYDPDRGHVADELTLLCPEHHRDKTHNRLALETVLAANAAPYNLRNDASGAKRLEFHGGVCAIFVGNNAVSARLSEGHATVAVGVDGIPLVAFEVWEGRLVATLQLFNEYNELILRIVGNELTYHALSWDIRFEGNRLTVHEGSRQYLLDLELNMPNQIQVRRARLLCNGVEIVVQRDGTVVVGNMSIGSGLVLGRGLSGLVLIGPNWPKGMGAVQYKRHNRYGSGTAAHTAWEAEQASEGASGATGDPAAG